MRSGIIGFFLGMLVIMLALVIVRQRAIHAVEYEITARFDRYVFDGPEFPHADFEMDRIVHRLLFPSRITTNFYDARYQEVTRADQPGRYGAVVTMTIGSDVLHRFITLYRTPGKVPWSATLPIPLPLPPELGLDPAVVRNQQGEIGAMLNRGLTGGGEASQDWAILLAGLAETLPGDPPAVSRTDVVARDDAWWEGLRERLGLAPRYPFWVDLPHDYDADPARHWPLILYLTVGAEKGTDLQRVRGSSLGLVLQSGKQIPAVVIAPQCPPDEKNWNLIALSRLLDMVAARYRVDPDRIYLTGGGQIWALAMTYPERFAAILPIEGDTDPADGARLKDVPVWAFHGAGDEVTPISRTIDMLAAIRQAGGHTHLTITKSRGDVWDEVYGTEAIYPWLLAQKRGQPEAITPGVPAW